MSLIVKKLVPFLVAFTLLILCGIFSAAESPVREERIRDAFAVQSGQKPADGAAMNDINRVGQPG